MRRVIIFATVLIPLVFATGLVGWAVHATFIAGTTSGPDFVQTLKSGSISTSSISSIEVVEPAVGHTPFSASEYDRLLRVKTFSDAVSIGQLVTLFESAQPGRKHQNHPASTYRVYLKVNCHDGFFWLYVDVLQDAKGSVFVLDANTRNAVNPNGASTYFLDDPSDVLAVLSHDENTEPDAT
jgi:hypothetical protein